MENGEIKKYLDNMKIIIQSETPKYLTYVCKEYARFSNENYKIAMELRSMITSQSHNKGSIYAILMDKDGSLNSIAISKLSEVSDVASFTKTVNALTEQKFDFGDISSSDLIVSGMQIAEKLAQEIKELETNIDTGSEEVDEGSVAGIEAKTEIALQNAGKLGSMGAGILAVLAGVRNRISSVVNRIRSKKNKEEENFVDEKNDDADNTLNSGTKKNKTDSKTGIISTVFPRVNTPLIVAATANNYFKNLGNKNGRENITKAEEEQEEQEEQDL